VSGVDDVVSGDRVSERGIPARTPGDIIEREGERETTGKTLPFFFITPKTRVE